MIGFVSCQHQRPPSDSLSLSPSPLTLSPLTPLTPLTLSLLSHVAAAAAAVVVVAVTMLAAGAVFPVMKCDDGVW